MPYYGARIDESSSSDAVPGPIKPITEWTGPKSGSRYQEFVAAQKYGQEYVPGQAAGTAAKLAAQNAYKYKYGFTDATQPVSNTKPIVTTPVKEPVKEPVTVPVDLTTPAWTLEGDPAYQAAMAAGQAKFNYARNAAMADKNAQELAAKNERKQLDVNSTESRRRLAGNYAARGMAGGAAGALTLAEAQANARQVAAQTSIKDKIAAVDMQFLENFGAVGTDWTGTLVGQQYKTDAAQAAITAQLARLGAA